MKALCLFVLISLPAFSLDQTVVCNYTRGEVISRTTGLRVLRSFDPRVFAARRLEVEKRGDEISGQNLVGVPLAFLGTNTCQQDRTRPNLTCYRVEIGRGEELHVFMAPRKMVLVKDLAIPGGATQEDSYLCNR